MTWRMIPKRSIRNIQFALLIVSTGWGLDYLLPPTEDGKINNYIENHSYWPLPIWGVIMVVFGTIGIICEILINRNEIKYWKFWLGSWTAHAVFASIFLTLAWGAFVSAPLDNQGWAGWRTPVMWGFIGLLHATYARRLDKPVKVLKDLDDDF